jgi:hypothetical protein
MITEILFENDRKAAATYFLITILGILIGLLTRLSHNEEIQVSGILLFVGSLCSFFALLAVMFGDAPTGFIAAGIYSFICIIMAILVAFVGEPFFFAFACIGGGISLIVAVHRKKIAWAIIGWVIFALGLYVLQNLLF